MAYKTAGNMMISLVKAIGETAKQSAKSLIQYEHTTAKDEELYFNRRRYYATL